MNAPAATAEYTDEQLRLAWRVCKLRTWPATFEEAMEDATYSRLVRLHAWHIAHPSKKRQPAAAAPGAAHCPAAPAPRPQLPSRPPGYVDHKRAAAGDRDDD